MYFIALYPSRIIDNLGKYLTPILIIIIAILCILVIFNPEGSIGQATGDYAKTPVVSGILQGYFTMDLVAALAFSVVIVQMFKMHGIEDHRTLVKCN